MKLEFGTVEELNAARDALNAVEEDPTIKYVLEVEVADESPEADVNRRSDDYLPREGCKAFRIAKEVLNHDKEWVTISDLSDDSEVRDRLTGHITALVKRHGVLERQPAADGSQSSYEYRVKDKFRPELTDVDVTRPKPGASV